MVSEYMTDVCLCAWWMIGLFDIFDAFLTELRTVMHAEL